MIGKSNVLYDHVFVARVGVFGPFPLPVRRPFVDNVASFDAAKITANLRIQVKEIAFLVFRRINSLHLVKWKGLFQGCQRLSSWLCATPATLLPFTVANRWVFFR